MKKQILVAALAVIGGQVLFSPAAQSHDHDWNRGVMPGYGYGYGVNPYYNNVNNFNNGFYNNRILRHERHEERRAIRRWDERHNRWF